MEPLSNIIGGLKRREPQGDYKYQELLASAAEFGIAPGGPPLPTFPKICRATVNVLLVGCTLIGTICHDRD